MDDLLTALNSDLQVDNTIDLLAPNFNDRGEDSIMDVVRAVSMRKVTGDHAYANYLNFKKEVDAFGYQAAVDSAIDQWKGYNRSIYGDVFNESLNQGTEEATQTAMDIQEALQQDETQLEKPWRDEALVAQANGQSEKFALMQYLSKDVYEKVSGSGFWDTVGNIAGSILPTDFVETYKAFGGEDELRRMIAAFSAGTPDEMYAMWPEIQARANEAANLLGYFNEDVYLKYMNMFLNPIESDIAIRRGVAEDIIDSTIAFDIGAAGKGVVNIARRRNAIKILKDAGNKQGAAEVNVAVMEDATGEISKAANVSKEDAAINAMPFNNEKHLPDVTDGISAEHQALAERVQRARQKLESEYVDDVTGQSLVDESPLSPAERDAAKRKAIESINELFEQQKNVYLDNVDFFTIAEDGRGFTIKFDVYDNRGQITAKGVERRFDYDLSDVGEFTGTMKLGPIISHVWSPERWASALMPGAVAKATRSEFKRAALGSRLDSTFAKIVKPLNRKETKTLDAILKKGAEWEDPKSGLITGKVFSIDELRKGIPLDNGIYRMSEKEITAYYQMRDFMDNLWWMKNKQVRDLLVFNKFKEVEITPSASSSQLDRVIGRPFETVQSIPDEVTKNKNYKIWDTRKKGSVRLSHSLKYSDLYEDGYRVVRLREPAKLNDELVQWALVKTDNVSDLRNTVLNYSQGYVPRIYDEGYWFVKERIPAKISGVEDESLRTLRMFKTKTEAEQFVARDFADNPKIEILHDRQTAALTEEGYILQSGGLFTTPRKEVMVKMGMAGDEPTTLNPYESIQRYIQNISNSVPFNEFRMSMQRRWVETAKKAGAFKNPGKATFEDAIVHPDESVQRALERSREWIKDQLRFPTPAETAWSHNMWKLSAWLENKPAVGGKVAKWTADLASKDPFSAMRGAAFHAHLGWFNPAQIFIQAQGASIAFGLMGPKAFARALPRYWALRATYFMDNSPEAIAKIAKAAGVSVDEALEMKTALRKLGIVEATARSQADYAAARQGLDGMGVMDAIANGVRKGAEKGLFFFNEGERFTRMMAFVKAWDDWKIANPGKKITDAALRDIEDITINNMLNLSRANRATWQTGALSIPTQFMQYTAKFFEALAPERLFKEGTTGSGFTASQKMRVMMGQTLLYGAAGIPLMTQGVNYVREMMGDMPDNIDDSKIEQWIWNVIEQGLTGQVAQTLALGTEVETASRFAGASGIEDIMEFAYTLLEDPSKVSMDMVGAFGGIATRVGGAFDWMKPIFMAKDYELTGSEILSGIDYFGDIIGSWNNLSKAYAIARLGQYRGRDGRVVVDFGEENLTAAFIKAAGFNPKVIQDTYDLSKYNWSVDKKMKDLKEMSRRALTDYIFSAQTDQDRINYQARVNMATESLGMNQSVADKVIGDLFEEIGKGESHQAKEAQDAIKKLVETGLWSAGGQSVLGNSALRNE